MRVDEFDYDLPPELIAQVPVEPRDRSRLLVLHRQGGTIEHRHFYDLPQYLRVGDALVINETRVIPARLFGHKETGGKVEALLLRPMSDRVWEALVRPGRRLQPGTRIVFSDELAARVIDVLPGGNRLLDFEYSGDFAALLDRLGRVPLPPYITAELADPERYQTVYGRERGSAAAPTAGLHFTPELLAGIAAQGIDIVRLTLHVGIGTFRPVKVERLEDHVMHQEYYSVSAAAAARVNAARARGGRVVAVGTTSVRTLETVTDEQGVVHAGEGWTGIFIYPGYRYRAVDVMITNFHLPKSTLLMLVSAFAGRDRIMAAYAEAIAQRYRFFSFGDAMLIL
ncbi:MAG: tRNA preQ1(34) S-adenosylmethionine ribosyltransferase-isomerase QueA [Chloroflexota bacterium]